MANTSYLQPNVSVYVVGGHFRGTLLSPPTTQTGCLTAYILEPKLQNDKKIPKWDPHARLGMFVGFCTLHSFLIPLVFNLRTGRFCLSIM